MMGQKAMVKTEQRNAMGTSPLYISTMRKLNIPAGMAACTNMTFRNSGSSTKYPATSKSATGMSIQRANIIPKVILPSAKNLYPFMVS